MANLFPVRKNEVHRVTTGHLERGEQPQAVVPVPQLGFHLVEIKREAGRRRANDRQHQSRRKKESLDPLSCVKPLVGKR
ncbi:MAG: hypothetical protein R3E74_14845 [Pseudomonadales bacterium]